MYDSFPELGTKRLRLREVRRRDSEAIFRVFSDDRVTMHYDCESFAAESQANKLIETWAEAYRLRRSVRWGISFKDNDILIGSCGYYRFHERNRRAAIGYELLPSYWGQGIMKEALGAIIDFGLQRVGLHRIEAFVMPDNSRSRVLLESLGFREEGLLREYEIWGDKGFVDLSVFGLLWRT